MVVFKIDKSDSKSQSKVQAPNPKRQIQKWKGKFGLLAVSQILWACCEQISIMPSRKIYYRKGIKGYSYANKHVYVDT